MADLIANKEAETTAVVSVIFHDNGPSYLFRAGQIPGDKGDQVIVETSKGEEMGIVRFRKEIVADAARQKELKPVLRLPGEQDLLSREHFFQLEPEALRRCKAATRKHQLLMKIVGAHYSYDGKRLTFYFTAEGRVDFRMLVKELATDFGTRIELRQIGPRDEVALLDTVGVCGQATCCGGFLTRPLSPTTTMARNQDLNTRNTEAITGLCGRLKCCLSYEDGLYQELKKDMPRIGERFRFDEHDVKVIHRRILTGEVVMVHREGEGEKRITVDLQTFLSKAKPQTAAGKA